MSYRIEFLGIAEEELDDALEWYAAQKADLSAEFVLALDVILKHISDNPRLFPVVHDEMRRALFQRFPYAVVYEIHEPEVVLVLAITHQKQDPKRWLDR